MLALMYSGDMCYWMWESSGADTPTTTAGETEASTGSKPKKVSSDATRRGCKDIKSEKVQCTDSESAGKDTVDSSPPSHTVDTPSSSDSSHLAPQPDSAHVKGDTGCDDDNRTCSTADEGRVISTSPNPNKPSIKEVTEKVKDVDLKSGETSHLQLHSNESTPPSQKVEKSHQTVGDGKNRTIQQKPLPLSDLYHLIQRAAGEGVMSRWLTDFEPHKCGLEMLSKYIDAARGPLKGHSWEYSRAFKLVVKLKRAAAQSPVK